MDNRVFESGAVAGTPAAPAIPSTGHPTDGNPALGIEATWPGSYWFYQLSEELRAVIVASGIAPNHLVLNQLLLALRGGFGLAKSLGANGYITLPGGLILQWGAGTSNGSGDLAVTWPLAFPTAYRSVVAIENGPAIAGVAANPSNTACDFYTAAGQTVWWIAIGY